MDFRELVYVVAVADCRSITAAARKLYISQPSLSQIISRIEKEEGVRLFDRSMSPLSLTYAGEKYVETARRILLMKDNLKRELRDIGQGTSGRISLGIPVERSGYMLPPVLPGFKERYPGFEVRTREAKSELLLEWLHKGEVDFIILPGEADSFGGDVTVERIYQEELKLAVREGKLEPRFLLEAPDCVNVKMLQELPLIHVAGGHAIRRMVDRFLKASKLTPQVVLEMESTLSCVQMVSAGCGAAIVPERSMKVLREDYGVKGYHLGTERQMWDVNAVYLKDTYLDEAERYLIGLMKSHFSAE